MFLDPLASRRRLFTTAFLLSTLSTPGCGGGGGGGDAPAQGTAQKDEVLAAADTTGIDSEKLASILNRNSPWGVATSSFLQRDPASWLPAMAAADIGSVRGFHDDQVAPIIAAGMSPVGFLVWSPGTVQTMPVADLPGWQRYVARQVRRFKGQVKYWEVWNEPPNFTADPSPVSYGKVVAAAYDAAKAVDPTVQIGLSAKSNHLNFLAESIAGGAADKFDFISLHPYEIATLLPAGWEGAYMGIVPRVRQMLQVRSPSKANVPVWFTEIGASAAPPSAGGMGEPMQADVLTKIYTMAFAQGVARTYWFDPVDSEGLMMGLVTADGVRRPSWQAMRTLNAYLGERPLYGGWTQPANAWYGFVFAGMRGVMLSAWTRPGQTADVALASEVTVVDPRTGNTRNARGSVTLTPSPVLLVAPYGSAQSLRWLREGADSAGKPFPWNGDHSAAASVSLTAGVEPDGVFIVNPPPVTTVNGVAEYNLAGGIGACFGVDPTFMTYAYAARPVRLTVQVRGHGVGTPGFHVLYESDAPIASTDVNNLQEISDGWYAVEGTQFREKSWTLPNARFVGQYGYNICLYTTGGDKGALSVRKVTVSR